MSNYFQGKSDHPYHLSVGAVLLNDKNEVACHYFVDAPVIGGEVCILMRESVEEGERLEESLVRGLMEEFGAVGEIINFIGSKETSYESKGVSIQKTTLYFLVRLKGIDEKSRLENDPESSSKIIWLNLDEGIRKMESIYKERKISDINESDILERAKLEIFTSS